MATIGRRAYAEMFGPTVGDRLRLADTELILEVEADHTLRAGSYGEEVKFGGGKTIRDGMAQSQRTNAGTGTGPCGSGAGSCWAWAGQAAATTHKVATTEAAWRRDARRSGEGLADTSPLKTERSINGL